MMLFKVGLAVAALTVGAATLTAGAPAAHAKSACRMPGLSHTANCNDPATVHKSDALGLEQAQPEAANGPCRPGFTKEGAFLCTSGVRGPNSFANAELDCRDIQARVSGYTDWRYRIFRGDGVNAPVGFWLGPITADDTALYVNSTDVGNFDGETSRFDSRSYTCSY